MKLQNCWNSSTPDFDIEWDRYLQADVVKIRKCWYTDVESDDDESMILDLYTIDTVWSEMSYRRYKE